MKKLSSMLLVLSLIFLLTACGNTQQLIESAVADVKKERFSVGIMLPDIGLGDQSFNDQAIEGLVQARDELDILFDYREPTMVETLEQGLEELVAEKHDLVIGIGYSVQEDLEKIAKKYPKQQFLLVDSISEVDNIDSITFREYEGSYLAGALAAMTSKSGVIGFVGGMVDPVIEKFLLGYKEGAESINPNIKLLVEYANTYSDDKIGAQLASEMIAQNADVLYAAAGYTGVGLLQEAQKQHVLAIGVDSDQYFYAEKAVVTSMLKNTDVAIYDIVKRYIEEKPKEKLTLEYGIAEDGIMLAPIRVVDNLIELEERLDTIKQSFVER